jgi:hypothetical protein
MARRFKESTVNKWVTKNPGKTAGGVTSGAALGSLLLVMLLSQGLIGLENCTGDTRCAGNSLDPCIAQCDMPVYEDFFIYPSESWGFTTNKKLHSSDQYFREKGSTEWYDITSSCTETGCGGKGTYSFRFNSGTTYEVLVKGYKESPFDIVKWTLGNESLGVENDPLWDGANCANETFYTRIDSTLKCDDEPTNKSCITSKTKTRVLNYTYFTVKEDGEFSTKEKRIAEYKSYSDSQRRKGCQIIIQE